MVCARTIAPAKRIESAVAMRVTHQATDTLNDHGRGLRHFPSFWSRGSIALTRKDCTPNVLQGNSGAARMSRQCSALALPLWAFHPGELPHVPGCHPAAQ
jgi:hypothetical protein